MSQETLQNTSPNSKFIHSQENQAGLNSYIKKESNIIREIFSYDNPLETLANELKTELLTKKSYKCVQCKSCINNNNSCDSSKREKRNPLCFECCKAMIKQRPKRKVKKIVASNELTNDNGVLKRRTSMSRKSIGGNGTRLHVCKDCKDGFSSKKSLVRHRSMAHKKIRNYPCPECQMTFNRVNALTTHVSAVHEKIKPFLCIECHASFSQKVNLNDHISSIHRKLKPFQCSDCGSAFSRKGHLSKHVTAVHKQIKPYKCGVCDSTFSRKHHMAHHVASVHEKLRPHGCNICDSSFSCKRNLAKHISSVHMKVKPYHCTDCGSNFSEKRNLTAHVITKHTQLKLFHCSVCEMDFSLKRYLDHHIATMHKELKDSAPWGFSQSQDPVTQLKKHLATMKETLVSQDHVSSEPFYAATFMEEEKMSPDEEHSIFSGHGRPLMSLGEDFDDGLIPDETRLILDQHRPIVTLHEISDPFEHHLPHLQDYHLRDLPSHHMITTVDHTLSYDSMPS